MKVVVTGSAGFLGQHIGQALTSAGHEVVGLDLVYSRWHDLRFSEIVGTQFTEHADADLCIHLAAKVGRMFGEDDPMETITDNVGITALVAKACGERGIRLAYASTSEVYGDNGSAICEEEDGPWSLPHNLYGVTKLTGERVCEHYAPDGLVVFRFSMPFGPGLPAGRGRAAIINMLHQALHRKPIPVHKGAERAWCYVGDTVEGVMTVLDSGCPGAWNIGRDDNPTSMLDVARIACDLTGADPGELITVVEPPAMQTVVKRLSTQKLRWLGWRPRVELADGMDMTLQWVRTLTETGEIAA